MDYRANGFCGAFFGPKGRDSIALGEALGDDHVRQGQPQRGETHATSRWSRAPLGLAIVRRFLTQGCALGYRVLPRWGKDTDTGGLTPNGAHFVGKIAGTFHVPSAILRLTAHGMCLPLFKVTAIGLTPPRSPVCQQEGGTT